MKPEELLRKVRQIEIGTRKRVDDLLSGNYRSHFRGSGVQFSEHRQYVPGDDVRHIDWKVSARSRDPLVKQFEEERELTVLLLVDASGSESFGSEGSLKIEAVAEACAMIAFAAILAGDKVGLVLFDGEVRKLLPPKKGKQQFIRILREILAFEPKEGGTALGPALDAARRVMKHSGIVFVASDFQATGYETPLRLLARRHDVVSLEVSDPRDREVPDVGTFLAVDPETGEEAWVDTGSYAFREWMKRSREAQESERARVLGSSGVERVALRTEEQYLDVLVRFFRLRKRRKSRGGGK